MRMRKKKFGAPPPPPPKDTADNRVISQPPSSQPDAAPIAEEPSTLSVGEVEGSPNNRTADEKRCECLMVNGWSRKLALGCVIPLASCLWPRGRIQATILLVLFVFLTRHGGILNPLFSPLPLHHRELQERPVHVGHWQQRHLLQLVRLQPPRRHRLRLLRLRIRSVLPL